MRSGHAGDDGEPAATGDSVDLQRRPGPQPLQCRQVALSEEFVDAEVQAIGRLVEVHCRELRALLLIHIGDAVVEPGNRDPTIGMVQPGEDRRQGMHRVGDGAAVPSGVQVPVRSGDLDVESQQALRPERQRRLRRPPHPAVGRDDQVRRALRSVRADEVGQVRTTDLLLAFEQERHVERQPPVLGDELPDDFDRDVARALVVGRTATADTVLAVVAGVAGQLERRGRPLVRVTDGLHVVVAVHQYRRPARRPGPPGQDDGVPTGLENSDVGEIQPGRQPLRGREPWWPARRPG